MKAFELLITAVSIALVLAPASAAKAWWQPSLADGNAQYQLGELFKVPDHLISGVKVKISLAAACAVIAYCSVRPAVHRQTRRARRVAPTWWLLGVSSHR
jgi:hypothetical protein